MKQGFAWILIGALCAASAAVAEPPGGESPQALVERMAAAAENGDFRDLAACMDPESRSEMAQGLLAATTMMVAFADFGGAMAGEMAEGMAEAFGEEGAEEEAAEAGEAAREAAAAETAELMESYRAILAEHGLERMMDEDPGGEEDLDDLLAGVDQIELIGDLMDFMDGFPGSESEQTSPMMKASDVTDYVIDGDHATARSPDGPVEFVRIDGRWYAKAGPGGMNEGD